MNIKLELSQGKTLEFEQHRSFEDSVFAHLRLDNGYVASVITRKPYSKNNGLWNSAQGSWNDDTFELGILNKDLIFVQLEELNDDEEYEINYGVWKNLSKDELLQKIQRISNLKGE